MGKKKFFPVAVATFIWIWPTVFIKFLSPYFDPYTQNFYRYLATVLFLLPINLIFYRDDFLNSLRSIRKFILPVILVFCFQTVWVQAIYLLKPAIVALVSKSSVLFTAFLSFVFFADERKVIRSKSFVWGSLMALAGVIGVIIGKRAAEFHGFGPGIFIALLSALIWAVYLIAIKTVVRETGSLVSVTVVFLFAVPLFLAASLLFGNPGQVLRVSRGVNTVLLMSGILCVGLASVFNYKSIKVLGTAISSTFVLIAPFFTAVVSYFMFNEVLTVWQVLSGGVLVGGCILLVRGGTAA